MDKGAFTSTTVVSIVLYSFCSASMLLVNKVTVGLIPNATLVTLAQLLATTGFVLALKCIRDCGIGPLSAGPAIEGFAWTSAKPYILYCVGFALGIFCSIKTLEASNVETIIVFRCLTPLLVCFLDATFLGRELPSRRSIASLGIIVAGAVGYVLSDAEFAAKGVGVYFWASVYVLVLCFNMVYGKHIISSVELSLSGTVLYNNAFSVVPMVLLGLAEGDLLPAKSSSFTASDLTTGALTALFISCVVGTGISYAGWFCRSQTSATTFTLVGVMNKIATIIINIIMWDKHATPAGVLCLLLCIAGGTMYKQAPMRAKPMANRYARKVNDDNDNCNDIIVNNNKNNNNNIADISMIEIGRLRDNDGISGNDVNADNLCVARSRSKRWGVSFDDAADSEDMASLLPSSSPR